MREKVGSWLLVVRVTDQVLVAAILSVTLGLGAAPAGRLLFAALLVVPFWSFLHRWFGLYDSHRVDGWRSAVSSTLTASTVGFVLGATLLGLAGLWRYVTQLAQFTAVWIALVLVSRAAMYTVLRMIRRHGADRRYVCIIGSWQNAEAMAREFRERPEWGLHVSIVGVGPPSDRVFYRFPGEGRRSETDPEPTVLGRRLEDVVHDQVVDEILIAAHPKDLAEEREAVRVSKSLGVQCRICIMGPDATATQVEYLPGHLAWTLHDGEHTSRGLGVKRMIDVAVSASLLVALGPLFVILAILVKVSSPGPVFFRQTRTGLRGRPFVLIKFRTMVSDADSMLQSVAHRNITGGPIFKDSEDLRVTEIGRILRRFSLDELPQLVNVLRGDMSLVGPRPLPLHESVAIEGEHRRRFKMKPGLTCRWQVAGRSQIGFLQWMQLDLDYVDNWSLGEDLKLLLLTIPAVLSGKGAY